MTWFKDPGFAEEREWRVIHRVTRAHDPGTVEYRTSNQLLVPYVPLDLQSAAGVNAQRLPIASVIAGPTTDRALAVTSTTEALKKYGYAMVRASASRVPLR